MTRLKLWLAALAASLSVLAAWAQRRTGAADQRARQAIETLGKMEAGNEAVEQMSSSDRTDWLEQLRKK